ncbi:MAG: helix-turn-helix transcriptional regulator [Deltaproteobacteria bacterium]|nr:helix-turn-helix transcriptional regulator [Deltaproteobacteria bacterium]
MQSTLVLERQFRLHVLHREQLLFDSHFSPSPKQGAAGITLYFVVAGSFQIADRVLEAPLVFALAEDEFERVTPASRTFRSWGDPSVTIELRVAAEHVCGSVGLDAGPRELSEWMWARTSAFSTACFSNEPDETLVQAWLVDLVEDGLIAPALVESIVLPEPEAFTRLWAACRPLYANHTTNASILQIKRATGLSLRQLTRDLGMMTRAFGLGGSFRDTTRVLRLRAAIVLLSAPGGTATKIATLVGYKSLDAMGRAFREAKLPPPSIVQDTIRYPHV